MSLFAEFRALDRRNWYLAGARLVVSFGFSMVLPFLAMHLTVERKQPAVVIGVIWALAGVCGAAMQWVAGTLSDRIGRRPVMVASMILRAANLAGLGWATATEASVVVIGALIIANAILRAFLDPVSNALVADLSPPEQRVAAFSLQRVGINIGWAAGPAMAAVASYSTLFYAAAAISLVTVFALLAIDEPPRSTSARPPRWREMFTYLGDRALVRFLLATVAIFILQVQLYQSLSIYAAQALHLDRAAVGTLYTLNGIMVVFLQLPAVRFIRRIGTGPALLVGCFTYAASYALVGLAQGYLTLLACVAFVTLAEMVTAPAQQATVTSLAPPGRIGVYAGLFGLCQVAGQSIGPLVGTTALQGLAGGAGAMPSRVAWFVLALFGVVAARMYKPRPN